MPFVSSRITSGQFIGPLQGTATTASFAVTASFWSGSIKNAESASFATTASYWSGSIQNATSASLAITASHAVTALSSSWALSASHAGRANDTDLFYGRNLAQFITTGSVDNQQTISGSLTITQNLTVLGSASIAYVTASSTVVDQNTITVKASGSGLPTAGLVVADTASQYSGSSFLYNIVDAIWSLNAPLSASVIGTASWAQSASIATSSSYALSSSYAISASYTVSSSYAETTTSSSFASTASFVNTLRQTVTITGSLNVSGSFNGVGITTGLGNVEGNVAFGTTLANIDTSGSSDAGQYNVAIGRSALDGNTTGNYNTALNRALVNNTTGYWNTALGYNSMFFNQFGGRNVAIGMWTMPQIDNSIDNTALGTEAGRFVQAGGGMSLASSSIFIGSSTRARLNNQTNQIVIGANAIGNGSNTTTIGNLNTTLTILRGTVSASLFTGSLSGSLIGTASNALTASYLSPLATASYALTASLSSTASNALTASYLDMYATASYALTASYLVSASYSVTASAAISSSWALTASYVANATSFPYTGSATISGSLVVDGTVQATTLLGTASYALTASYLSGSIESASYATTLSSSYLVTSSLVGSTLTFLKGDGTTFNLDLPASSNSGSSAVFEFTSSSTRWDIAHNFGQREVSVTLYDSNFLQIGASQISASDANNTSVYFTYPVSGKAVVLATGGTPRLDYAVTGSNQFVGNQIITGSLTVTSTIHGTASNAVSASNAETASYGITSISSSYAATASYLATASFAGTASYVLNAPEWDGSLSGSNFNVNSNYATLQSDNNLILIGDFITMYPKTGFNISGGNAVNIQTPRVIFSGDTVFEGVDFTFAYKNGVRSSQNGTSANWIWPIPFTENGYHVDYKAMAGSNMSVGTLLVLRDGSSAVVQTAGTASMGTTNIAWTTATSGSVPVIAAQINDGNQYNIKFTIRR